MVRKEMSYEEIQDGHLDLQLGRCPMKNFKGGRHGRCLGYWNGTILAILNLHVATMTPTKFQLNPNYGFGGDVENVKS